MGAGAGAPGIRAGANAAQPVDAVRRIVQYEIGQQTLSGGSYAKYGQIANPVERGAAIAADRGGLAKGLIPEASGLSQFPKTIPKGLTPLATGVAGAAGAKIPSCGC